MISGGQMDATEIGFSCSASMAVAKVELIPVDEQTGRPKGTPSRTLVSTLTSPGGRIQAAGGTFQHWVLTAAGGGGSGTLKLSALYLHPFMVGEKYEVVVHFEEEGAGGGVAVARSAWHVGVASHWLELQVVNMTGDKLGYEGLWGDVDNTTEGRFHENVWFNQTGSKKRNPKVIELELALRGPPEHLQLGALLDALPVTCRLLYARDTSATAMPVDSHFEDKFEWALDAARGEGQSGGTGCRSDSGGAGGGSGDGPEPPPPPPSIATMRCPVALKCRIHTVSFKHKQIAEMMGCKNQFVIKVEPVVPAAPVPAAPVPAARVAPFVTSAHPLQVLSKIIDSHKVRVRVFPSAPPSSVGQ